MIRLSWPQQQRRRHVERSRDRLMRARFPRSGSRSARGSQRSHAVCLGRRLVPEVRGELPVAVALPRSLATRQVWRPLLPYKPQRFNKRSVRRRARAKRRR